MRKPRDFESVLNDFLNDEVIPIEAYYRYSGRPKPVRQTPEEKKELDLKKMELKPALKEERKIPYIYKSKAAYVEEDYIAI